MLLRARQSGANKGDGTLPTPGTGSLGHEVLLSSQLWEEILRFLLQQKSPQAVLCGAEQLSELVPGCRQTHGVLLPQSASPRRCRWTWGLCLPGWHHSGFSTSSFRFAICFWQFPLLCCQPVGDEEVCVLFAAAWKSPFMAVPLWGQPCVVKLSPTLSHHHRGCV